MLVVVLNDGETYTSIEGCVVLDVPSDVPDEHVDEYVSENFEYGIPVSSRF